MANLSLLRHTKRASTMLRSRSIVILIFVMIFFAGTSFAGTDMVTFDKQNTLVGEIKKLERGKLTFKTDSTGTIGIEWDDVTALVSDQNLQFELTSGKRHLGHLVNAPGTGKLSLKTEEDIITLPIVSVVSIFPIENVFRERFEGSMRAGYDFTKRSDVEQYDLGLDLEYRTKKRVFSLGIDSSVTDESEETTERQDFQLDYQGLRPNRWFTGGLIQVQKNDELGIDLRTSIGGGMGRYLSQTNTNNLSLFGGLLVSSEKIEETGAKDTLLEGIFILSYDWFRFNEPEFDINSSLKVYPSVSDFGRVRGDLDLVFRWELVHDFFWEMKFYDSYDTGASGTSGSSNDYGINTSFGYEF